MGHIIGETYQNVREGGRWVIYFALWGAKAEFFLCSREAVAGKGGEALHLIISFPFCNHPLGARSYLVRGTVYTSKHGEKP